MSSITQCPICGKAGIPDYLKEDVICPNCNSDLSVYRALHLAAGGNDISGCGVRKYKRLAIVLPIVAVLLVGVIGLIYLNTEKRNLQQQLNEANAVIANLKTAQVSVDTVQPNSESAQSYTEYVILHNDSPWNIVRKFYGNRSDWWDIARKIAEDNNIWDEQKGSWKTIHPGQIIRINNM